MPLVSFVFVSFVNFKVLPRLQRRIDVWYDPLSHSRVIQVNSMNLQRYVPTFGDFIFALIFSVDLEKRSKVTFIWEIS